METKERIISIRLLEKIKKKPEYKKIIDIDAKYRERMTVEKTKD